MLDEDLAILYSVTTKRLNEQVRRNLDRFPNDFMFRLNNQEVIRLRSQIATSKIGRGGRRYRPYAFTEHGAVMLANVLSSKVAVDTSIQVVRAFIRLRELAISHTDLARRIDKMEEKYDVKFKVVFDAIRRLITPPPREQLSTIPAWNPPPNMEYLPLFLTFILSAARRV